MKLSIIRKSIKILDSVSYKNYSDGRSNTYLEYMQGYRADEDKLIEPILFRKFLEQVLGFEFGKTIATQEYKGSGKPDFIPVDIRTHPFVFDAKGTDTHDLSKHFKQIKRYIKSQELKHGILTNMRDLDVYTSESNIEIEKYDFNFVQLYRDFRNSPKECLEKDNTKRFLSFVRQFSYTPLTRQKKIQRIADSKEWTGEEELNVTALINQLRHVVERLKDDVRDLVNVLLKSAEAGSVSEESVLNEIKDIYAHISGTAISDPENWNISTVIGAKERSPYWGAVNAYMRRVGYFAMTRLLLARTWEDIGFIDQSLYDGGFRKLFKNLNEEIGDVLAHSFRLASKHYPWLFNTHNNYSWYEPSDEALIDTLYELSNFYLGKLNQDILGTIYEDYIEKVDKKNKGQYYTPREIVSFIWDRVGYDNPKAFFYHVDGKRIPNLVYDPATGSGGFLVEAARRIRECTVFDWNEIKDVKDIHNAILWNVYGSEISSFPFYLTQVNLLIQLTHVIKSIIKLTGRKLREKPTPLGVICRDSLELHNPELRLFDEEDSEKEDDAQKEIVHFTIADQKIYEKIKEKRVGRFSFVCANPPYIGEKGHKELFRQTLEHFPYWKKYYQGKMDYLYWFIVLGLSKLRRWGKLGFVTTAYWPTASGASKLRKYILENAKINEIIFFEGVKLFEHAKGQRNMVFVLTKCQGKDYNEERQNNHIKIVTVKCKNEDLPGENIRQNLKFLTEHIQRNIKKSNYKDEYCRVFWCGLKQGELTEKPWNLTYTKKTAKVLAKIEDKGEPLANLCNINQGVVSGAPKLNSNNISLLTHDTIISHDLKPSDGIFILSSNKLDSLHLSKSEKDIIKPYFKSTVINRYFLDLDSLENLIYTTKTTKIDRYPVIKNHLNIFKPILEKRLERYGENYPWFKLHRERNNSIFEYEKIVTPNFAKKNTFAYSRSAFYSEFDVYFITRKDATESLEYITGLLNSQLLDFWMSHKSKKKGEKGEIRVYNTTSLSAIPIRRINFDNTKDIEFHDKIVEEVRLLENKMLELSKFAGFFIGDIFSRLNSDILLNNTNDKAIIRNISQNLYNLRTHPLLKIERSKEIKDSELYLRSITKPEMILTGEAQIKLKGKGKVSVLIEGSYKILELLSSVLSNWVNQPFDVIKEELLLPGDIEDFHKKKKDILSEVEGIRSEILDLQKGIDKIVLQLYDIDQK